MAVLDQQQINHSGSQQHIYGTNYDAQTFQAGLSGDLSTVKLWTCLNWGSPSNLIVEIQGVSVNKPDGNVLASEEISSASISDNTELIVTFSSPYTITSGTKYSIILHQKNDEGDASNYYSFYGAGANTYVTGDYEYSIDSGSAWTINSTFDLYFKTYVDYQELFLHDSMTVEAGKTVFMHDSMDVVEITEELLDINNDFRTREYWTLNDINNDIRTIPPQEELFDLDNDFRMYGTFARIDINNDFRFADFAITNLNNDFRMVGEIVYGDLNNDLRTKKQEAINIGNIFITVKAEAIDIDNKVNTCIELIEDTNNIIVFTKAELLDVSNDFRTKKEIRYEVNNDFRMLSPWQVPEEGEVGFQSAGKTEVKVYINSAEQTDVDVNSIVFTENLNAPAIASFNLGRAYDSSKPAMDSNVEIKYKGILLYKGYITEINPTDSPESIKVSCQGEYWNLNKDKKYFFVGRKPVDTNEYYYETIKDALNDLGFSYDIGNIIPQTIDLYGEGLANAISNLVQNSGNFGWFIKPDGTKRLWQAGEGNIIDLEPQQLNQNLGLYQVIRHNIRESIIELVNKFRVLMGNWTVRENTEDLSTGSGTKTYTYVYPKNITVYAIPAWNRNLENVAKGSITGYGYDYQNPDLDYKDVFRKFYLPYIDPKTESWTDKFPPLVEILWGDYPGWTNKRTYLTEGFSIDYGFKSPFGSPLGASDLTKPSISFSEPIVVYDKDGSNECYNIRPKTIRLYLWKEHKVTYTVNDQSSPDDAPVEDSNNPLMFYTDKMGSYPETIIETSNLASLSKQEGFIIKDEEGNIIEYIPSWDDTDFAKDYADWQLSKNCDKKITGSIDITIDALLYYNIDLSKRIKINGIIDPVNIVSINYNFNNFIATLNIEKNRYYRRTENYPYHGE